MDNTFFLSFIIFSIFAFFSSFSPLDFSFSFLFTFHFPLLFLSPSVYLKESYIWTCRSYSTCFNLPKAENADILHQTQLWIWRRRRKRIQGEWGEKGQTRKEINFIWIIIAFSGERLLVMSKDIDVWDKGMFHGHRNNRILGSGCDKKEK